MRQKRRKKKGTAVSDILLPLDALAQARAGSKKSKEKKDKLEPPTSEQINTLLFASFMIIFGAIFGISISSGPPAVLIVTTALSAVAGFVTFAQIAKWMHLWPLEKQAGFFDAAKRGHFVSHLFSTLSPTHYLIKPSEIERCVHKLYKAFAALFRLTKVAYAEAEKDGLFSIDDLKAKVLKQPPPPPQHYFGETVDHGDPFTDERGGGHTVRDQRMHSKRLALVPRFRPLPPKNGTEPAVGVKKRLLK